jgi:Glycosyl transferase family 2
MMDDLQRHRNPQPERSVRDYRLKSTGPSMPSSDTPLYYVVAQDYHDFRVIYVDDCSSDRTGELVEQFIADRSSGNLTHLIRSPVRIGALQNLYNTFTCAMMTVVLPQK